MRIRRLTVKNFGRFENYAVDFNGNLAVVNGQNEAGKSTIFDMIKVLLFGLPEEMSPEERMRYVRHGSNEAHISGEFEREDGSPLTLSRIISQFSCDLNINENFDFQNLGSVKAPIVQDLSKEVYENIYALDFHAMSSIKEDIWQGIKEEFMDADMAKELVSANEAISISRKKADELFKSIEGPSAINELLKERESLKDRLSEVNQDQKDAARDYLELDKTKREINDLQNKIEFESAFIQEATKMNGLKEDISRIKILAKEAGDLSPYKPWLPDIKEEYVSLLHEEEDARLSYENLLNKEQETEVVPDQQEEVPEKYKKALEYENEIRMLSISDPEKEDAESIGYVSESTESEQSDFLSFKEDESYYTQEQLNDNDDYSKAAENWKKVCAERLHDATHEEEIFKSLDQINAMSLAGKLELYSESKTQLDMLIESASHPKKSGTRTFFFIFTLIISILIVLSGVSLFFVNTIKDLLQNISPVNNIFDSFVDLFKIIPLDIPIIANLLTGIGLILLVSDFGFIKQKSAKSQLKSKEEVIKGAREEEEYNKAEFEKELYGLPVSKIKIKRADKSISEDVIELKEARQKLFEERRKKDEAAESEKTDDVKPDEEIVEPKAQPEENIADVPQEESEISKLANILLDFPFHDDEQNLNALNNLLDNAMEHVAKMQHSDAPQAKSPAPSPEEVAKLKAAYDKAKSELNEMEALLGENPLEEIESIQERYSKLNRAVVLRDEILEKYPNFKEISERLNHLSQAGWPYNEEAVSQAKDRIAECRDKIGEAQSKIGVMENNVKKALLGHDPSDIASEILALDDKILNSKMEYDKLRVSEQIIKDGQDTFSKLHQPEVLQRASYYLSILTDGKYSELDLDSETSEITVLTQNGNYMTPQAARLSQATREQIYLSIRLSVIESFDEGQEAMPITLDEALITWDKARLGAGLDLLAQIAKKRQILIFTCHDFIVEAMRENQPKAQIIELN